MRHTITTHIKTVLSYFIRAIFPPKRHSRMAEAINTAIIRQYIKPKIQNEHYTILPYHNSKIQSVLFACKYEADVQSTTIVADILGTYIAEILLEHNTIHNNPILITTVPPSTVRGKKEGYNHLTRIAKYIQKHQPHITIQKNILSYIRPVARQSTIRNRFARKKNIHNTMVANIIDNKIVCVFDDITTTGATLTEARRALLTAGATSVYTIAFARVD